MPTPISKDGFMPDAQARTVLDSRTLLRLDGRSALGQVIGPNKC